MLSDKKFTVFFITTMFIFLIISCGKSQDEAGQAVLHPAESNIPYHDHSHIPVSKINSGGGEDGKQFGLKKYLQSQSDDSGIKLDAQTMGPTHLFAESIDESRIVILDDGNHTMIEYDLENNKASEIATFGRGPGSISNVRDMTLKGNTLYVAMQGARLSAFDCSQTPCSYTKEIFLEEISPFSADINGEQVAALGMKPVSGQTSGNDALHFIPIHLFDNDGKLLKSGGKSYDTKGNWMLVRPFTEGIIRFLPETRGYIVAYHRLPYLFIYDTDLKLVESFEFEDFILGKQEYFPQEGRLNIVKEDHSTIKNLRLRKNGSVLVEIETRENIIRAERRYVWDQKSDFYRVYLDDKRSEYLGEVVFDETDSRQAVLLTDHGIIEANSDDLKWIGLEFNQNF